MANAIAIHDLQHMDASVLEGAGGFVTDWKGKPIGRNGGQMAIAGDRACLEEALVALKRSAS